MQPHSTSTKKACAPRGVLPFHKHAVDPAWHIPTEQECIALWDKYTMPGHIRAHSMQVAHISTELAEMAEMQKIPVCKKSVRSSALLHDIAKAYTIEYGGDHAALGGSIVMSETGNPYVAQGVIHHVHWDWPLDIDLCFLPLAIIYADKRVMHDTIVPLDKRFEDLIFRYGRTDRIIDTILKAKSLTEQLEQAFSERLGISLDEYSFNCGRLV